LHDRKLQDRRQKRDRILCVLQPQISFYKEKIYIGIEICWVRRQKFLNLGLLYIPIMLVNSMVMA